MIGSFKRLAFYICGAKLDPTASNSGFGSADGREHRIIGEELVLNTAANRDDGSNGARTVIARIPHISRLSGANGLDELCKDIIERCNTVSPQFFDRDFFQPN
jgi:hypothetical protein